MVSKTMTPKRVRGKVPPKQTNYKFEPTFKAWLRHVSETKYKSESDYVVDAIREKMEREGDWPPKKI